LWVNIDTINKNTETLNDASKEVGLEVNLEKTKYRLLPHDQNSDQNWDIKIGNRSFENVSRVQVFGNNSNKLKFDSGGNEEEIEFW
jgi:hypothetical protein